MRLLCHRTILSKVGACAIPGEVRFCVSSSLPFPGVVVVHPMRTGSIWHMCVNFVAQVCQLSGTCVPSWGSCRAAAEWFSTGPACAPGNLTDAREALSSLSVD